MCLKHEAVITVSAPRMVSNRDNGGAMFWTKTDFSLKCPTTPAGSHYSTETFCSWLWASPLYFFFNWKPEISSPSMTHIGPANGHVTARAGRAAVCSHSDLFAAEAGERLVSTELQRQPCRTDPHPAPQSTIVTGTTYVALMKQRRHKNASPAPPFWHWSPKHRLAPQQVIHTARGEPAFTLPWLSPTFKQNT